MIPFIRSINELRLLTNSKIEQDKIIINEKNECKINPVKEVKKVIKLPNLPLNTRNKWLKSKKSVSRFFDSLDYNNQIQPSYDLTLLERQNNTNQKKVA